MSFDVQAVRAQFPALNQEIDGRAPVFLDGPGGTQVPQGVLDAMTGYLGLYNSNLLNSSFFAVQKTHEIIAEAREKAAAFVNAQPHEIIFGPNMSSLTAHLSRSIANEWQAGDEIIVTQLDHFANVSFWQQIASDKDVTCHMAQIKTEDCTLDYEHLESLISPKTRLIAFTLASNLSGSLTDAQRIMAIAKGVGAMTYVDSVHYAPHFLPDLQALDCDFLACSPYKFYGPHLGIVFAKQEHLERLTPYKVEPALDEGPDRWENGTKSFEALAGFCSTINYMCSYNKNSNLRDNLKSFYHDISIYEQAWSAGFLERAQSVQGIKIHGITDVDRLAERTATFAFTIDDYPSQIIADHLADAGIATGSGNFYAKGVVDALGLSESGGVVRAGAVHYNTMEELDMLFEALGSL